MAKPGTVIGWTLDQLERRDLLERWPPRYAQIVAHHVTLATDAGNGPLPHPVRGEIIGRADDESGVEAMVVAIDSSIARPDGSVFHITWSLGDGRRARESNDLIKSRGWQAHEHPVPISLTPARI